MAGPVASLTADDAALFPIDANGKAEPALRSRHRRCLCPLLIEPVTGEVQIKQAGTVLKA